MTTVRYKQRVDWWVALILVGTVLLFALAIPTVPDDEVPILVGSMGLTALFLLPFFHGYVELREDVLFVRTGWLWQTIPYRNIKHVRRCTNLYSSMALTVHRIEIVEVDKPRWRGTTYIGPKDRDAVMNELTWRISQHRNEA